MAVVVVGGVVTSTLFKLFVLPGLYVRFGPHPEARPVDLTATGVFGDGHRSRGADGKPMATEAKEAVDAAP
jgi:hypothetical protein